MNSQHVSGPDRRRFACSDLRLTSTLEVFADNVEGERPVFAWDTLGFSCDCLSCLRLLPKLSQLCLNLLQFAGDLLPSSVLGIIRGRFSSTASLLGPEGPTFEIPLLDFYVGQDAVQVEFSARDC
jgi:hypothetical protein